MRIVPLLVALLTFTLPARSEPRQGVYLETGYFTRLRDGSPTAAWGERSEIPVAFEIRPRIDGGVPEAIAIWNWHEGEEVAFSPDTASRPCNCGRPTEIPINWEVTGNDLPDHIAIRSRGNGARYAFIWAGPIAEIAVAYHAIGGTWHDAQGGTWTFTETGEWHTPAASYRYRLLLDHVMFDEDILELGADPADATVPRTEDGKPYLIFEVPRPGTLVLRRLHHNGQDGFFPYKPAEIWRILRR